MYLYGGATGLDYPIAGEMTPVVEIPFLTLSPPSSQNCEGIDIASTGEWIVDVLLDPTNEAATIRGGTLDGITYGEQDCAFSGRFTQIALKLTGNSVGAAKISNITIRHNGQEPQT